MHHFVCLKPRVDVLTVSNSVKEVQVIITSWLAMLQIWHHNRLFTSSAYYLPCPINRHINCTSCLDTSEKSYQFMIKKFWCALLNGCVVNCIIPNTYRNFSKSVDGNHHHPHPLFFNFKWTYCVTNLGLVFISKNIISIL